MYAIRGIDEGVYGGEVGRADSEGKVQSTVDVLKKATKFFLVLISGTRDTSTEETEGNEEIRATTHADV
jgi:hypothetical protein